MAHNEVNFDDTNQMSCINFVLSLALSTNTKS